MDYLFGLKTKEFVLLASDDMVARGIGVLKSDREKSYTLGTNMRMLCIGEGGEADQFAEYIAKNIQLYKMRNDYELSPSAAACFTRKTMADALRTREPYFVHLMIGGWDKHEGTYLTYVDYLATQYDAPYMLHGYGGMMSYSILDRIYRDDFTKDEALDAMKKCFAELKKRFIVNLPSFSVYFIDKNGVSERMHVTIDGEVK